MQLSSVHSGLPSDVVILCNGGRSEHKRCERHGLDVADHLSVLGYVVGGQAKGGAQFGRPPRFNPSSSRSDATAATQSPQSTKSGEHQPNGTRKRDRAGRRNDDRPTDTREGEHESRSGVWSGKSGSSRIAGRLTERVELRADQTESGQRSGFGPGRPVEDVELVGFTGKQRPKAEVEVCTLIIRAEVEQIGVGQGAADCGPEGERVRSC